VAVFYGGVPIKQNIELLSSDQKPHIIVGTPGRILELVRKKVRPPSLPPSLPSLS